MAGRLRRIGALLHKDATWARRDWEFALLTIGPMLVVFAVNFGGDLLSTSTLPKVAVVDTNGTFAGHLEATERLEVLRVDNKAEATELLREESVKLVVLVPTAFETTARSQKGKPPTLDVILDSGALRSGTDSIRVVKVALERFAHPRLPAQIRTTSLQGEVSTKSMLLHIVIVLETLFIGIFFIPLSLGEEKERGLLEALALSPATVGEIVGAKVIFGMAAIVLASTIIIVGTGAWGASVGWTLAFLLAGGACFVAWGLSIALFMKTRKSAELASTLALLVISQPVFLKDAIPGLAAFAAYMPGDWFASGIREALAGQTAPTAALARLSGLLVVGTIGYGLCGWFLRAKDRT